MSSSFANKLKLFEREEKILNIKKEKNYARQTDKRMTHKGIWILSDSLMQYWK